MTVHIIITGGTLDKVHDTLTEGLVFAAENESQVPNVLRIGRCYHPVTNILMQKDSLDMTKEDRAAILTAVQNSDSDRIIITHGTGTMEQTAHYLDGRITDKTIILTGAMRPQSLGQSDAGFNLGGAVIAAQTLDFGVFAVMNGRVFEAAHVHKDKVLGRFDSEE